VTQSPSRMFMKGARDCFIGRVSSGEPMAKGTTLLSCFIRTRHRLIWPVAVLPPLWKEIHSTSACCYYTILDFSMREIHVLLRRCRPSSGNCVRAISSSVTLKVTISASRRTPFWSAPFGTPAVLDRRDEARALFERVLACRNRHGLFRRSAWWDSSAPLAGCPFLGRRPFEAGIFYAINLRNL
jgi:hypothetical protein